MRGPSSDGGEIVIRVRKLHDAHRVEYKNGDGKWEYAGEIDGGKFWPHHLRTTVFTPAELRQIADHIDKITYADQA